MWNGNGDEIGELLELCGIGVAMGNAINEVNGKADCVIGNNDEDNIAEFLAATIY